MSVYLNISEVNALTNNQFDQVFSNVIELCTEASSVVNKRRPLKNVTELCEAFYKYLDDLSENEKLVVLKLHPDLAGRLAAQGELTRESASEQRRAGLEELTVEQKNIIDANNERYKAKFGFPFIICARENKVQSIVEGLRRRYNNSREEEIITGINEVKKICRFRILDIVSSD